MMLRGLRQVRSQKIVIARCNPFSSLSFARIGEYVVTWALQSGTFIFFLALYGMGQLLVPSDIDLPSSSASPSLDLANNSSDERLSAEEL